MNHLFYILLFTLNKSTPDTLQIGINEIYYFTTSKTCISCQKIFVPFFNEENKKKLKVINLTFKEDSKYLYYVAEKEKKVKDYFSVDSALVIDINRYDTTKKIKFTTSLQSGFFVYLKKGKLEYLDVSNLIRQKSNKNIINKHILRRILRS